MAFDSITRGKLQRLVASCRNLLTDEFDDQLQSIYGIYADDGRLLDLDKLATLDDDQRAIGTLLRERIAHLQSGLVNSKTPLADAVQRVLREQAFTVLNRFAALRMAEERELVLQCVGDGFNSKGFQVFENVASPDLGSQYHRYRIFLNCLFDELSLDLGVLFDRFSPLGLLFPREPKLREFLALVNDIELKSLWREDETIGWIYQYFNDDAERKEMREESSAPRNSRELAVRNQFFTPRYVVEFLTDNTLGRLWYEMTCGESALRDRCRYLVRRPTEFFVKPGESAPDSTAESEVNPGDNLSQEEILLQPVHIPHRPLKDPREIRLLDPACGSMHFGLYAFDLFTVMYDEAWEIVHGTDASAKSTETFTPFVTFAASFTDKTEFLREVPRLVIEHNIHGIDIDPRAAQIAGLSLWLRAQRAWHQAGLKPADRPRITRSNIVCAEPMPGEKELLREFVEQQFPTGERPAFAFLLEKIFDRMTLVGESGSLLRIEVDIRAAIAEARILAQQQSVPRQFPLFSGEKQPEQAEFNFRGLNDEQFWQAAERRIYHALEVYAEQAGSGGGFQRRLFVDDAARGFAFIDVCRKRYDVVVMNPPFGLPSEATDTWLRSVYPETSNDLYAAFSERAFEFTTGAHGYVGAITTKTFLYSKRLRHFRKQLAHPGHRLTFLIDIGLGVLDAMVRTAVWTAGQKISPHTLFWDWTHEDKDDLTDRALSLIQDTSCLPAVTRLEDFSVLPFGLFSYWCPPDVLHTVSSHSSFEPQFGESVKGLTSFDDFRFIRLQWEVQPESKLLGDWKYIAKGGGWSRYYTESVVLIDWRANGEIPRQNELMNYGTDARSKQSISFWNRPGLTFGEISDFGFSAQPQQKNNLFGGSGFCIFPRDSELLLTWLAFFNSQPVFSILSMYSTDRHWNSEMVAKLPVPDLTKVAKRLATLASRQFEIARSDGSASETSIDFLTYRFSPISEEGEAFVENQREIDSIIKEAFGISDSSLDILNKKFPLTTRRSVTVPEFDTSLELSFFVGLAFGRWDIRYATSGHPMPKLPDPFAPMPVCPPGMLKGDDGLPLSPEVGRRLHTEGRYPLDVAWEGILVDDLEHPLDLERRVHAALAIVWSDRAEALEYEASTALDVPTLREWFSRPAGFFADHLKRYSKSRRQAPIYWPLSTASGRYSIWLYYPRLTDQTLYRAVTEFLKPKLNSVTADVNRLQAKGQGGNARERAELQTLIDFQVELQELLDELLRVTQLPWKPNLNDGVLITACPLWKLFRLPKWQKDLKTCWDELSTGDYDWAHLAYSIWPERVRNKCKKDRSMSIAHDLEALCEVETQKPKSPKSKKTNKEESDSPVLLAQSLPHLADVHSRKSEPSHAESSAKLPIEQIDRSEVLCVIRQVFTSGGERDRETAMRDVAEALGYKRFGPRIREVLNTDFLTAVRRGILVNENGLLALAANDLRNYERESQKDAFLSAIGRAWLEREEAIRLFARWFGYARTGTVIDETSRSLINGLIRDSQLEKDGNRIRRAS